MADERLPIRTAGPQAFTKKKSRPTQLTGRIWGVGLRTRRRRTHTCALDLAERRPGFRPGAGFEPADLAVTCPEGTPACATGRLHVSRLLTTASEIWLRGEGSNPDLLVQSQVWYLFHHLAIEGFEPAPPSRNGASVSNPSPGRPVLTQLTAAGWFLSQRTAPQTARRPLLTPILHRHGTPRLLTGPVGRGPGPGPHTDSARVRARPR